MNNTNKIVVFDTTLRDGEQAVGSHMNHHQKMKVAEGLCRLNVDVIEAGFAASSPEEVRSIYDIAKTFGTEDGPIICSLARCVSNDIKMAGEQVQNAVKGRIHTFIATSDIHREYKFKGITREALKKKAVEGVTLAKSFVDDVLFSLEDFTRTDMDYAAEVTAATIMAGATTINFPDTVGYIKNPNDMKAMVQYVIENAKRIVIEKGGSPEGIIYAVHCHNDQGLALANTMAAVEGGVREVQVAMNGMGERCGNASLEQVVMNIRKRTANEFDPFSRQKEPLYGIDISHIKNQEIKEVSDIVEKASGNKVKRNAPYVGDDAFAHESGIHVQGILENPVTYETTDPAEVGAERKIIYGRRSGSAGLRVKYDLLDIGMDNEVMQQVADRFYDLTDNVDKADDADFVKAYVGDKEVPKHYEMVSYHPTIFPDESVGMVVVIKIEDEIMHLYGEGNGPVNAAVNAVEKEINVDYKVRDFNLAAASEGSDAPGDSTVKVSKNGWQVSGRSEHTDIVRSGVNAFLDACNRIKYMEDFYATR